MNSGSMENLWFIRNDLAYCSYSLICPPTRKLNPNRMSNTQRKDMPQKAASLSKLPWGKSCSWVSHALFVFWYPVWVLVCRLGDNFLNEHAFWGKSCSLVSGLFFGVCYCVFVLVYRLGDNFLNEPAVWGKSCCWVSDLLFGVWYFDWILVDRLAGTFLNERFLGK